MLVVYIYYTSYMIMIIFAKRAAGDNETYPAGLKRMFILQFAPSKSERPG